MANIVPVHSLSDPGMEHYAGLTENQLRNRLEPEMGVFIAESCKVIRTALDEGYEPISMLTEERHIEGQAKELIARMGNRPVYTGDAALLEKIAGFALSRSVLCAFRRPRERSVEEILRGARRIAVLEAVVDATNIGAIFRSAAALQVDGILLSTTCCDPLIRRCVRVSMGTTLQIPWAYAHDWPCQDTLHSYGFTSVAMALTDDSIPLGSPELAGLPKIAIVLGAEGDGLAPRTISACDKVCKIPIANHVDSLNVAAAGAVAFWELRVK